MNKQTNLLNSLALRTLTVSACRKIGRILRVQGPLLARWTWGDRYREKARRVCGLRHKLFCRNADAWCQPPLTLPERRCPTSSCQHYLLHLVRRIPFAPLILRKIKFFCAKHNIGSSRLFGASGATTFGLLHLLAKIRFVSAVCLTLLLSFEKSLRLPSPAELKAFTLLPSAKLYKSSRASSALEYRSLRPPSARSYESLRVSSAVT